MTTKKPRDIRTIWLGTWTRQDGTETDGTLEVDLDKIGRLVGRAAKKKTGEITLGYGSFKVRAAVKKGSSP